MIFINIVINIDYSILPSYRRDSYIDNLYFQLINTIHKDGILLRQLIKVNLRKAPST